MTATVVALVVILAGVAAGTPWVFEVLAAVGALVGVGVAFGALDRVPFGARRARSRPPPPQRPPAALSEQVAAHIDALDPVEHRSLDLGSPWPTVVVGPTGVRVVTVARSVELRTVRALSSVVDDVLELVDPDVTVTGVLVVPLEAGGHDPNGAVQVVGVGQLADVFSRGALVPMPVVVQVFTRLSGSLAPDLRDRTAI